MASIRKISDGRYKVLWREPIRDDFGVPTGKLRQTSETIAAQTDSAAMKLAQSRAREIEAALATSFRPIRALILNGCQKWLGHSTFTLTLDTYGDYINEDVALPAGLARPVSLIKQEKGKVVSIDRRSS